MNDQTINHAEEENMEAHDMSENEMNQSVESDEVPQSDEEQISDTQNESEDIDEQIESEEMDEPDEKDSSSGRRGLEDDDITMSERITGIRHTVATTAAPIRYREEEDIAQSTEDTTAKDNKKKQRLLPGVVCGAVIMAVLLAALIIASVIRLTPKSETVPEVPEQGIEITDNDSREPASDTEADNNEPADDTTEINASEAEPKDPADDPDKEKESESEKTDDTDSETETDKETESESGTESETVAEPTYHLYVDFYGHDPLDVYSEKKTIGEVLTENEYYLDENSVPNIDLNTLLAGDTYVVIDWYEYKTEIDYEQIEYGSSTNYVDTVPRGSTVVAVPGEYGVRELSYDVVYLNGEEVGRTYLGAEITKEPVDELLESGTGGTMITRDGQVVSYSYRKIVTATYYNIPGLTYLGTEADESVIATDMSCIPMGTNVYVKNDRYDFGYRTAADIGGDVKGWMIDIWMPDSDQSAQSQMMRQEGMVRDMEVYFLD